MAVAVKRENWLLELFRKAKEKYDTFFNQSWDVTENQQFAGGVATSSFDDVAGKTGGVTKAQIEQLKKAMERGDAEQEPNKGNNLVVETASVNEKAAQETMKAKTDVGGEMSQETPVKQIGDDD